MAKIKKKKTGPKSGFKKEYCSQLIDHMDKGYSFESFAGIIGIARSTLYRWEKHLEFKEAKEIGFAKCLLFWEKIGIDACMGKIMGFNGTSYVFNMKNRFNWKDKREVDTNVTASFEDVVKYMENATDENK